MASSVFVHGAPWLLRGDAGLLARAEVQVRALEPIDALLDALATESPEVLVVGLEIARTDLDKLSEKLAEPRFEKTALVLVSRRPASQKVLDRAARIRRPARVVIGPERARARVIEVIAELFGVAPRYHWRAEDQREVSVCQNTGQLPPGRLLNLSRTGAKAWLPIDLPTGATIKLAFGLKDGPIEVTCRVARKSTLPGETLPALGLEFLELGISDASRLRNEVEGPEAEPADVPPETFEAPRQEQRVKVPRSMPISLRVRKARDTRISYLKLSDLSESGLRAMARGYTPPFAQGDRLEAELMVASIKLSCEVEVLRLVPSGKSTEVGFRLTRLAPSDRGTMARLLTIAREGKGEKRAAASA